jgi:hypothetical protein
MMKAIAKAFWLLALLSQSSAQAKDFQLRIELVRCEPDGLLSALREKYAPKDFWVEQHVVLEMQIERRWEYVAALDQCRSIPEEVGRTKCLLHVRNGQEALKKCERHARLLCRKHGAYC